MSFIDRLSAESQTAGLSFLRRRTAVFFTFFFPIILLLIFGALITVDEGVFSEPPGYYLPGYLAVVVVFTPLSRLSSTVTRHRETRRFEKLATTPLSPLEWVLARTMVTIVIVGLSAVLVVLLAIGLTAASVSIHPLHGLFIGLGTAIFSGLGITIGRIADSRDGAIAASNAIGLPLIFLSETFIPPTMLPVWFRPVLSLSPLTYFARGSRALFFETGGWFRSLLVLSGVTLIIVWIALRLLPWRH